VPDDRRDFLGTGWRFPLSVNPSGGLSWSSGERDIAESIWIVLSTAPGERVMEPEFGCGAHQLLFDNDTAVTRAEIAHHVTVALVQYEPRIDVLDVQVDDAGASDIDALLVSVDYRIRANNALNNLVYPLYVTEGMVT
jgi:phage baseplate assembly protein W